MGGVKPNSLRRLSAFSNPLTFSAPVADTSPTRSAAVLALTLRTPAVSLTASSRLALIQLSEASRARKKPTRLRRWLSAQGRFTAKIVLGKSGRTSLFFFQAEDGIRAWSVTGVQTCALPI